MIPGEVKFCIRCGTPLVPQVVMNEERPACPECGWVFYSDPKVAVAVLVEQEGRVLLTRRVNEPHQGEWSLPAGFMNAFEDPAEAAERECREETGLTVEVGEILSIITGREHPRGADIIIVYRASCTGGSLIAGDDADQVAFFSRDALPVLAFRATRIALGLE